MWPFQLNLDSFLLLLEPRGHSCSKDVWCPWPWESRKVVSLWVDCWVGLLSAILYNPLQAPKCWVLEWYLPGSFSPGWPWGSGAPRWEGLDALQGQHEVHCRKSGARSRGPRRSTAMRRSRGTTALEKGPEGARETRSKHEGSLRACMFTGAETQA